MAFKSQNGHFLQEVIRPGFAAGSGWRSSQPLTIDLGRCRQSRCLWSLLQLLHQCIDCRIGLGDRVGKYLAAEFLPLDGDLVNLRNAQKPECGDQCGLQVVERFQLATRAKAHATARSENDRVARPVSQ